MNATETLTCRPSGPSLYPLVQAAVLSYSITSNINLVSYKMFQNVLFLLHFWPLVYWLYSQPSASDCSSYVQGCIYRPLVLAAKPAFFSPFLLCVSGFVYMLAWCCVCLRDTTGTLWWELTQGWTKPSSVTIPWLLSKVCVLCVCLYMCVWDRKIKVNFRGGKEEKA